MEFPANSIPTSDRETAERVKPIRKQWAGTMTPRERYNAQMNFESFDRSVNTEFGYWDDNFRLWDIFVDNGITDGLEAEYFFGFDPQRSIGHHEWMCPAYDEKVIEISGDHKIIQNSSGLIAEVPVDGHETIPHFLKSSVVTPDDWARCKAERFNPDHPNRVVDTQAILDQHPAERTYPLGVCAGSMIGYVRDILTFEGLAYATFDYPDMVEDMVETMCVLTEQYLDQVLAKVQFDFAIGWEDICFKNGPIVTPQFFKDIVVPRYKRIKAKLDAGRVGIWFTDCDGDVRPILELMMEGGMNAICPCEINASGHPGELLDMYPGHLRVLGGFDKMKMREGKAAIKAYTESLVPYVERGGFMPHCDHRCPPDVSPENYLYYLDLKEEMFGLK